MLRITYVAESPNACAWYRCYTPGSALERRGHDVSLEYLSTPLRVRKSDVVVFLRPARQGILGAIRSANQQGALTVVDIDDDLWRIHPSNPSYRYLMQGPARQVLEACIREAKLVTVTTRELAESIKHLTSARVLSNMLPAEHWPDSPRRPRDGTALTLGWAGGSSHLMDLQVISGAVETLLGQYDQLEVVVAGLGMSPFAPHERVKVAPGVPIEEYPGLLGQFDIAVAPVEDSVFNTSKSDLKLLEYSMMGIPTVASKTVTYGRSIRQGENGFLAGNTKDWLKYLRRIIEDPDLRVCMGAKAREFAETRTIDKNIHLWEKAYGIGS